MSPSPLPAPAPSFGQATWLSGAASGTNQTSGTPCTYRDNWMIAKQSLKLDYIRIPSLTVPASYGPTLALSANASSIATYYNVGSTRLVYRATAYVSIEKEVSSCYDTSTYFQPQKFVVLGASADHQGQNYGGAGDFNASTLGPQGSVDTLLEAYWRRPWNDGVDTEMVSSMTLYNTMNYITDKNDRIFLASEDEQWGGNPFVHSGPIANTPYTLKNTFTSYNDPRTKYFAALDPRYNLPGDYRYSRESFYDIVAWVDGVGQAIKSNKLVPNEQEYLGQKSGMAAYNPNWHNWL